MKEAARLQIVKAIELRTGMFAKGKIVPLMTGEGEP